MVGARALAADLVSVSAGGVAVTEVVERGRVVAAVRCVLGRGDPTVPLAHEVCGVARGVQLLRDRRRVVRYAARQL